MSASEQTQFRCVVGAASCVVTPEVGTYHRMWGAAEHEVSIGVHRPLEAHVLFLADAAASSATDADASASAAGADASASAAGAAAAGEAIAYISIDICMLMEHDFQRIRPIVASASGLEPPQLLFCCTHTHAAGLMDSRRSGQPGGEKIEPYLQRLAAAVGRAVKEAYDGRVAGWGQLVRGRCSLAHARDQRLDDGRHVVGLAGPADDAMICGRFSDLEGKPLATLINYGCHPTTLAWANKLISPDYVGAARELIRTRYENAPCIFLQGASGDTGPRVGFVGDVEQAERNGRQLGYAALSALESLDPPGTDYRYVRPVVSGATIGVWEHAKLRWQTGEAAEAAEATEATEAGARAEARPSVASFEVALDYRDGLGTLEGVDAEEAEWRGRPDDAPDRGAMLERIRRKRMRLEALPRGLSRFPYHVTLQRLGGHAVFLTLEGELYSNLQLELRKRFPSLLLVITTLANGYRCSYLPARESLGKGMYQEDVAVLAAGSLEALIEALSERLSAVESIVS